MSATHPEVLAQARKVLGEYLSQIRVFRGLSEEQLASAVGLELAEVQAVERGGEYPVDHLLSYVRGVDCYFFLGSRDGQHLDLDHMVNKMKDPI